MKTKKTVIAVITATLLVSAMLIVGCLDQIDEITVKDKNNEIINDGGTNVDGASIGDTNVKGVDNQIPVGKGVVRFKIADNNVRTILPNFNQYAENGSNVAKMFFDIKFTRTTAGADQGKVIYFPGTGSYETAPGTPPGSKGTYADVTAPITLPNGDYSFLITAYNNISGTIPIAGYTSVPSTGDINVSTGETGVAGPFTLIPFIGDDEGSLVYNITIAPDNAYTTNIVNIYEYSDLSSPVDYIDLNDDGTAKTGSLSLMSGYYLVKVIVAKTHFLTRQYTEALHVYPGFNSIMDTIDIPALVQNEFSVNFNMNSRPVDNDSDPAFDEQYIKYAKLVSEPSEEPEATDTDYVFKGWYKEIGTTNKWDFTKDWILNNTILYARWIQNIGFGIELQENGESMSALTGATSIQRGFMDGQNKITLSLGSPVGGGIWTTIEWSIADDQVDLSFFNNESSLVIVNGEDADGNDFSPLFAGTGTTSFTVSVRGWNSADSKWYSRKATISVTGAATQP